MELEFLRWLRGRLPPHPQLRVPPGDDAAVLAHTPGSDCVITSDLLMDGVHFELAECGPRAAGYKSLAVNLSDLAAMAARPVAAIVSIALPQADAQKLAVELYEGLLPLADRFGVTIAGGDTNCWDGPLVINIAALGETTEHGPLLRSGARPGDQILVTGELGGSILGKHLHFAPRVEEALLLNSRYRLHAGMDISDGLSLDLSRLAAESRCGAVIELAAVPVSPAAQQLAGSGADERSAWEHALADGEDFELLLAAPPEEAERIVREQPLSIPLTRIGEFVAEAGLWRVDERGRREPLPPRGYEHGAAG
jgi:thiamine-monophosphate kinase